ncbi:MAG: acyltransferase family protein [Actinomadura sp.]
MTQRIFCTLDGIRGVAALCIVVLHAHRFFGDLLPSAQMAVDLFFVLSGFVLAHAYEPRFRDGMTPLRFMCQRFARLYPLYLLGIGLGVVQAVLFLHYHQGSMTWTWSALLAALPFAFVMLPTPFDAGLFPLNGVMWSIFFELVANAIWVLFWRPLRSTKVLVAVILGSGVLLAVAAHGYDTMALGANWHTAPGGLARVTYSFMLGVLLYRVRESVWLPRVPPVVLLAALPMLAAFDLSTSAQLLCALFVFPALVLLGARVEPSGTAGVVCHKLGVASYGVYTLHKRLYMLSYAALLHFFGIQAEAFAPWGGLVFLVLLVVGCVILTNVFERPARRALSRLLDRRLPARV